jgi:hypothetical protein
MVIRNRCKTVKLRLRKELDRLQKESGVHREIIRTLATTAEEKGREASATKVEMVRQKAKILRWETLIARESKKLVIKMDASPGFPEGMLCLELKKRMLIEKFLVSTPDSSNLTSHLKYLWRKTALFHLVENLTM